MNGAEAYIMLARILIAFATLLLASKLALGAPSIALKAVVNGLSAPVDIAHPGDGSGRLFVVQQTGQIRIFDGAQLLTAPFLDIASLILAGGERGLLGIAFHPNYASNGFFYLNYTRAGDGATVIARYARSPANPNIADPGSALILLTIPQPFENHNGGQLRFGPDGYLYIGMGDGGSGNDPGNRAQSLSSLLGKMLRIDVNGGVPYAIPAGNPFASDGDPNTLGEIWAFGLRNPWRFAFDRLTGDLFIADVGQGAWEEVDFQPNGVGGANYGWRVMEGKHCTGLGGNPPCFHAGLTVPILEYDHSQGCSITGGFRYRGSAIPALRGHYIYGDFCSGRIWGGTRDQGGNWSTAEILDTDLNISTFGEDQAGEIYVADMSAGTVYRIVGLPGRDFNGDGKADILWRHTNGTVGIWLMDGGAVLSTPPAWGMSTEWIVQQVGDFNGDGKADILWRHTNGTVGIWLMDGGAVPSAPPAWSMSTEWIVQQVGDFNGDGKADILWRHTNGTVGIWLMDGGAVLSVPRAWGMSTEWAIQRVGDFNGDGKADILWRHTNGTVGIWLMDGGAVLSTPPAWGMSTQWAIQRVGDFNGDGKADILWRHTNGTVGIWLMDGGAVISAPPAWRMSTEWTIQRVGDFNGDGKADILWRHINGTVGIWLMDGGAVLPAPPAWGMSTEWVIKQVEDFNGDGKADILWRHTNGTIGIWLMDGGAILSAPSAWSMSTDWIVQDKD